MLLALAQFWLPARHPASTAGTSATLASPAAFEDLRPTVTSVSPMGGAVGVNPCTAVSAYVHVPTQGGVDNATITATTVKLYQVNADNTLVPIESRVNGTGGGDAINLSPVVGLKANTKYKLVVTDGVRSVAGYAFYPFESY
ncbi:MAG TPA: Ig-like domain-containing protein, partial [Cytophagales bacterium]